jgi:hypothetical protein
MAYLVRDVRTGTAGKYQGAAHGGGIAGVGLKGRRMGIFLVLPSEKSGWQEWANQNFNSARPAQCGGVPGVGFLLEGTTLVGSCLLCCGKRVENNGNELQE